MDNITRILFSALFLGLLGLIFYKANSTVGYIWWGLACFYCWALTEKITNG